MTGCKETPDQSTVSDLLKYIYIATGTVLHLTRFDFLGQLLSAHQDGEGIPAAVGFMDLSDLHRVVHQEILNGYRPGLPVQRVRIVPKGEEMQHLAKKRLRA